MLPRNRRPERRQARRDSDSVLVIGAGSAGLEAAPRALGLRGYQIAIAEAGTALGGRVIRESLAEPFRTRRVRDYRHDQISQLPNIEIYFESRLSAEDILPLGSKM